MSIKKALSRKDRWHHAYLLVGDRQSVLAELFPILKEAGVGGSNHPNYFYLESHHLGIDESRELRRRAALGERYFVINTFSLTREAQNALLKTVEEPQSQVHFFVLVPHVYGLLPTFLSRFVIINAGGVTGQTKEGISVSQFLASTPKERLKMLAPFSIKHDDPEARREIKKRALFFLSELEVELEGRLPEGAATLEKVLNLKKYLYMESAQVGLILDHLAFVV